MKKTICFGLLLFLVTMIAFTDVTRVNADEKASKVTITIYDGITVDSSTSESKQDEETSETHSEKKEIQQNLPQTNDGNNLYYSVLGVIIFLIAIVRILYNKKRNGEKYNEKN
ncbi:LPXTG cell wall anchor domain-containing protein [Enterococcus casseliflavus]|nr:LPXTG cell wall anchor domain-containing protein [Enterococcus casseliflavus]MBF0014424.1 LPXTG cell wall anchor domain-containing protein [Enterococcus casseliflavus]